MNKNPVRITIEDNRSGETITTKFEMEEEISSRGKPKKCTYTLKNKTTGEVIGSRGFKRGIREIANLLPN